MWSDAYVKAYSLVRSFVRALRPRSCCTFAASVSHTLYSQTNGARDTLLTVVHDEVTVALKLQHDEPFGVQNLHVHPVGDSERLADLLHTRMDQ